MSPRVLIEPADLRQAARTYRDARASLSDVRGRLLSVPPRMPGSLSAPTAQVLEHSIRDLTEQLDYMAFEATALQRRARFAELAADGGFNPFLDMFDPFGLGGVPALGERFKMPPPPKPPKKGFWDKGVPGFLSGAAGNVYSTGAGAVDLAITPFSSKRRKDFVDGLSYGYHHPGEAFDALWADMSAEKDRKAGKGMKAAGSITMEVAGLFVAPLKLTKLKAVKKAAEAAKASRNATSGAARAAGDLAREARQRLASGPRWRTGEVPWQPTGAAPGRWADPEHFRHVVCGPAQQTAQAARRSAAEAQRAFVAAQRDYDRWHEALAAADRYGNLDIAAKLEKITQELDRRSAAGGSGR